MQALGRTRALGAMLGVIAMGCGADEGGSNDAPPIFESGIDGGLDGATGSGDAAAYTCTSYTAPTATTCGGSHCEQAPEKLRTDTPTSATCGSSQLRVPA